MASLEAAALEEVALLLVDWVPLWSNPCGAMSAVSNRIITFRVLVRDRQGRQHEAWVKYGKLWWLSLEREVLWASTKPYEETLAERLEKRQSARTHSGNATEELLFK